MLSHTYTALKILVTDGPAKLLRIISNKYFNLIYSRGLLNGATRPLAISGLIALEQLHLLLSEQAIATPVETGWQIRDVRTFRLNREIPHLFENFVETHHGSRRHIEILSDRYQDAGFVEIEPDDTVIDVGAYVGTFTQYAVERGASCVVAVDPSAQVYDSLYTNTEEYGNVTVIPKAAWSERDTIDLQLSLHPHQNSVIEPDEFDLEETIKVDADTVPNIAQDVGISEIDFLKIEAEGVEPEILLATLADEITVEKIVINAGYERYGESTAERVTDLLDRYDYQWQIDEQTMNVFARRCQ